jgi:hypothetical protein
MTTSNNPFHFKVSIGPSLSDKHTAGLIMLRIAGCESRKLAIVSVVDQEKPQVIDIGQYM